MRYFVRLAALIGCIVGAVAVSPASAKRRLALSVGIDVYDKSTWHGNSLRLMRNIFLSAHILALLVSLPTYPARSADNSPPIQKQHSDTATRHATAQLDEAQILNGRLDAQIDIWMNRSNVPGLAASIVIGRKIVWSRGYGMAQIARKIRFTPDSILQIASLSKPITATCIMQLRDRGLLRLDDDVNKFLTFSVRNPKYPGTPITLRHLLTHTSSIDDSDLYYSMYTVGDPITSLADAVTSYFSPSGALWSPENYDDYAPGAKHHYANAGFALLGHIVQVISKQPLEEYLRQNIYTPLKMTDTSFYIGKLDRQKQALPYTFTGKLGSKLFMEAGDENLLLPGVALSKAGYIEHALYSYPTLADGMVRTSVNQLVNFMIAIMNEGQFHNTKLLSKASVDEMLTGEDMGLGWFRMGEYWGHDGHDPGLSTAIMFKPQDKVGFIIFANTELELKPVKELLMAHVLSMLR